VKDFEHHHQTFIEEWNRYEQNCVRIFRMHIDRAFREYLAWYQRGDVDKTVSMMDQ
jgi:hypothetical protein